MEQKMLTLCNGSAPIIRLALLERLGVELPDALQHDLPPPLLLLRQPGRGGVGLGQPGQGHHHGHPVASHGHHLDGIFLTLLTGGVNCSSATTWHGPP